jgi:hypothetical protein
VIGFGDEIMASGQARKLFDADPSRRVAICDHRDRPRWHEVWDHNPIIATPAAVAAGERVQLLRNAKFCRPYVQYPFTQDSGWRWTGWRARDYIGEFHLTAGERSHGLSLRAQLGCFVLIEPTSKVTTTRNKDWGVARYQQVVSALPEIPFVRVRHDQTQDPSPLHGANVHELARLTFREVVGILMAADLYLGPEGGLHHAAAAVGTPAVVMFGGCVNVEAMGYPGQTLLVDTGPDSPCGRWLPCDHCAAALARISVETVLRAVRDRWAPEKWTFYESEVHLVSEPDPQGGRDLRDHSTADL